MQSRPARLFLVFLVLFFLADRGGYAALQNRITGEVQGGQRVALSHSVVPKAARALDLGAASSSLAMKSMTLFFSRTAEQQAALTQLLQDQQNPNSPEYHHWLTPQQFGARFGLSQSDLAKVTSWLTSQGLTVTGTALSSTFVTFSGTVGQVQSAFGTTIHRVSLNGEEYVANLTEPTLPAALAGVVGGIRGLSNFRLRPKGHRIQLKTSHPQSKLTIPVCTDSSCTSTTIEHYLAPGDFATIYDTTPLLSNSITGTGISIGVMGQLDLTDYLDSDVTQFRAASGLSANTPTQIVGGSTPPAPPSPSTCQGNNPPSSCDDLDESELDVEWAGAVAPGANILFVTSDNVIDSLTYAIDHNTAPILSISYGGCENQDFDATTMNELNAAFQEANAEGITIVGPSGDSGATDCVDTSTTSATTGLAVDFPASSPYVTGVGGTEFNEESGSYWDDSSATNGTYGPSALSYIPEMVWNDTASDIAANPSDPQFSSSGGGASAVFAKPTWQVGSGVPNDGKRDVPDLAFSASADHDGYIVCVQNLCQDDTYFASDNSFSVFGGTSVSTPSFAGILALLEQKLGGRIGNANPYIYALANGGSYASIFHDVTTGDNKQPCTVGTTGCTSSPIGFSAGTGYDQATGWGSVDASNFVGGVSGAITTPLPNPTTLSLAYTPSSLAIGDTVTITATVAHTASTTPTGSVTFTIDNGDTVSPQKVVLDSSGTATMTTSFSSNGSHSVSATYTGDTNYYGSSAEKSIIVGPVPTGAISVSASPASFTISSGGNLTSTITVTSSNGYAGTVNFTATAPALDGTPSFTPPSVTLTSGGSGKTTFSVTSVTAALKGKGSLKKGGSLSSLMAGGGITVAGLLFFGAFGERRRRWTTLLSLTIFAVLTTVVGCSSSSVNATSGSGGSSSGTGTYTITITGTDSVTNTITSSTNISVTIQ